MRSYRFLFLAALLVVAIGLGSTLLGQVEPHRDVGGVLSVLKKGQALTLKDHGTCYEITVFDGLDTPLGYQVVEVTNDCLVVKDIANVNVLRIPVYAVKSANTLRAGGRPPLPRP